MQSSRNPIAFQQSSVNALRSVELPHGVLIREYNNANERVYYEENGVHTFSMYLRGGYQTQRLDCSSSKGAPGHFCLMPAGSYSAWEIGDSQRFAHVYFSDTYIKQLALENFDTDPRCIDLPHLTFERSDTLLALLQHSILNWSWEQPDNHMLLQQGLQTLLLNLLGSLSLTKIGPSKPLKGGLSPAAQKKVRDFVQANLHRKILLCDLAKEVGLSEFHFARMFKVSFADSPQNFISKSRIEAVKQALVHSVGRSQPPLVQLAQHFGFASQSHMGKVFKQHVGVSPGQYAKLH
ncbi:MAG: helix-turn-helix domain-containing protein [Granulosicoccaceae bacterium]